MRGRERRWARRAAGLSWARRPDPPPARASRPTTRGPTGAWSSRSSPGLILFAVWVTARTVPPGAGGRRPDQPIRSLRGLRPTRRHSHHGRVLRPRRGARHQTRSPATVPSSAKSPRCARCAGRCKPNDTVVLMDGLWAPTIRAQCGLPVAQLVDPSPDTIVHTAQSIRPPGGPRVRRNRPGRPRQQGAGPTAGGQPEDQAGPAPVAATPNRNRRAPPRVLDRAPMTEPLESNPMSVETSTPPTAGAVSRAGADLGGPVAVRVDRAALLQRGSPRPAGDRAHLQGDGRVRLQLRAARGRRLLHRRHPRPAQDAEPMYPSLKVVAFHRNGGAGTVRRIGSRWPAARSSCGPTPT